MNPRRRFGLIATATVLLCAAATGCTATSTPQPSPTADATPPEPTMGTDQSDAVLGYAPTVREQGSTTGNMDSLPRVQEVTLHVGDVIAGPSSTMVTYWLSADPELSSVVGATPAQWQNLPSLIDPVGKREYSITLFQKPDGDYPIGLFPPVWQARAEPRPFTVAYPALPESVTSVEISHELFDPITVEVTHK